jgi:hypothetical protein
MTVPPTDRTASIAPRRLFAPLTNQARTTATSITATSSRRTLVVNRRPAPDLGDRSDIGASASTRSAGRLPARRSHARDGR